MLKIIRNPLGHAFLNLGCGNAYLPTWTNVDLQAKGMVQTCDIRKPIPVADGTFDAVYSSHVLEHLTEEDGMRLIKEIIRVLKPGGICRVAVPDLEEIGRLYIQTLETAHANPSEINLKRYRWMRLELLDQMTRLKSGGKMREALEAGDFDLSFLKERMADQFEMYWSEASGPARKHRRGLFRRLKTFFLPPVPPQQSGEAHLWMYDRLSLHLLFAAAGFTEIRRRAWNESSIPGWQEENLDRSKHGDGPRKPDSIYFEGSRPC